MVGKQLQRLLRVAALPDVLKTQYLTRFIYRMSVALTWSSYNTAVQAMPRKTNDNT